MKANVDVISALKQENIYLICFFQRIKKPPDPAKDWVVYL